MDLELSPELRERLARLALEDGVVVLLADLSDDPAIKDRLARTGYDRFARALLAQVAARTPEDRRLLGAWYKARNAQLGQREATPPGRVKPERAAAPVTTLPRPVKGA